ncbi:MAG: hypothetical protein GFH27_549303n31 [Chloroflexi bacterium AL-W]|nr:hypothetical protein [Chloroflexi bacterium AL-N1]NOK67916.1 hypothetical protein [Chloroflexi bacterium AL-N10]NOK73256.1 hypothetical protein [Chloroflexi bacterium AL-N5]NOK83170.1 hypothetical protein [Chloroflexi bacterium AL-W]NOK87587.1 hypothetical protein [Chloroflexi bacterium AL-N15]
MRRAWLVGICLLALMLMCYAGLLSSRERTWSRLIIPGVSDVRMSYGVSRVWVSYVLADDQNLHDVSRHLRNQGWVQIKMHPPVMDEMGVTLVRRDMNGFIQRTMTVRSLPPDRKLTDIRVRSCVKIQERLHCF